jgi:hypothetical protein
VPSLWLLLLLLVPAFERLAASVCLCLQMAFEQD